MPTNKIPTTTYFTAAERYLIDAAAAARGLSTANLLRVAVGKFLEIKIEPLTLGAPKGNKNASKTDR